MYKKILVPLDGSQLSECSLEHVKTIATGCNVPEVVLVRIIEPIHGYAVLGEDWYKEAENKAKATINNYLSGVADELRKSRINVTTVILQGEPAEEILGYAEKNNVDLIIHTTHGFSGIVRWAIGSVADRVIRHARVPVLTIAPPSCR